MLTESRLNELLTDLETDNIERTESINKTDKFGEARCAFANEQEERIASQSTQSRQICSDS